MKKLQQIVLAELENNEMARKSDAVLVREVLEKIEIDTSLPLANLLELGVGSKIETISRLRRRIQHERPDLCDEEVKKWRKENEQLWRDFVKN